MEDDRIVDDMAEVLRMDFPEPSGPQLDLGWRRLQSSLAKGAHERPPAWWSKIGVVRLSLAATAMAAVFVVVGLRFFPTKSPEPIAFEIRGAVVDPAGEVHAPTGAALLFSDESRLDTDAETSLRILDATDRGASILLAKGAMEVYVRPRARTAWRFQAGPYTVAVKGTAFRLGYDPARGRLDVRMRSGAVEIRGPQPDRVIDLRAGESLQLFADPVASQKDPAPVAQATQAIQAEPTPTSPAADPARPTGRKTQPRTTSHGTPKPGTAVALAGVTTKPSWPDYLAQGDFAAIVKDAEQRGLNDLWASAPAADLVALADAARYTHRFAIARQALLAIRARFPGGERSRDAAFFLGRLCESDRNAPEAAVTWYDTYLQEAPRGAYAALAMGRELALLADRGSPRAKELARRYLERFPTGNHADLARSLLN